MHHDAKDHRAKSGVFCSCVSVRFKIKKLKVIIKELVYKFMNQYPGFPYRPTQRLTSGFERTTTTKILNAWKTWQRGKILKAFADYSRVLSLHQAYFFIANDTNIYIKWVIEKNKDLHGKNYKIYLDKIKNQPKQTAFVLYSCCRRLSNVSWICQIAY